MDRQWRTYPSVRGAFDPCPALTPHAYIVSPNQYVSVQPRGLAQYPPREALRCGTLWPDLFSPYQPPTGAVRS